MTQPNKNNVITANRFRKSVGISAKPENNYTKKGVDKNGNVVYSDAKLANNQDPRTAKEYVTGILKVLQPFKVLSKDDATTLEIVADVSSDAAFLSQLGATIQAGDKKLFTNLLLNKYGTDIVTTVTNDPEKGKQFNALLQSYQLYNNWDMLSEAQKAIGVANVGIQTTDTFAGTNVDGMVIPGTESMFNGQGLTIGSALGAASLGVDTYELAKNWKQLDVLGRTVGVGQNVVSTINLAKEMGLLADSTTAAANAATVTKAAAQGTNATTPGFMDSIGKAGSVGSYVGAAGAAYNGYNQLQDTKNKSSDQRGNTAVQTAGRMVAAYATGGLSEAGAALTDVAFGDGTTQKLMDKSTSNIEKYGDLVMPGLGSSVKIASKVAGKLMGGTTKYTEYRNLKREFDAGRISEEEFNSKVENAVNMGRGGRGSIDPQADYQRAIDSGLGEEEAQRAKTYAELVKSGKDKESIALLRGKDIVGYGNVSEAVSKHAGKDWKDIPDAEREKYAQYLLDKGAIYSSKGSMNVKMNKEIEADLAAMGRGESPSGNIVSEKAYGVGAIKIPSAGAIPTGYKQVTNTPKGEVIAVPESVAYTAAFNAENQGNLNAATGKSNEIYRKWKRNIAEDQVDAPNSTVSMMAGFSNLAKSDPRMASAYFTSMGLTENNLRPELINSDKYQESMQLAAENFKLKENFNLPDGTIVNFGPNSTTREARYKELTGRSNLSLDDFKIDYTNDLDFLAGNAGLTLGRLVSGGITDESDLVGSRLGNAALGRIGYGQDFNADNFGVVIENLRSVYANQGVDSKESAMMLTNKLLEENRINEAQAFHMQQNVNIVFDGDYGTASTIINDGRFDGINNILKAKNVEDRFFNKGEVDPRNGKEIQSVGKTWPPTYFYSDGSKDYAEVKNTPYNPVDTNIGIAVNNTNNLGSGETSVVSVNTEKDKAIKRNEMQFGKGVTNATNTEQTNFDNAVGV